jgi:hypothetical protein
MHQTSDMTAVRKGVSQLGLWATGRMAKIECISRTQQVLRSEN